MPTRAATSRSVSSARPLSRARPQAASRISRRVAARRSLCLSRIGLSNMIRENAASVATRQGSVGLPGHLIPARTDEEVEVGPGVRLLHGLDVQALPAAG